MPAIPSVTGGAAGPSTANNTQNVGGFGNVNVSRGSDNTQTLLMVAALGLGFWLLTRKK